MVATQALISLCVFGLTAAVSQPVNQQVIVTDVVSALQPSIAKAVAEALSGLSRGSQFAQSSSSNGFASLSGSGSSTGFASGSRFAGASSTGSGSSTGFTSGSQFAGASSTGSRSSTGFTSGSRFAGASSTGSGSTTSTGFASGSRFASGTSSAGSSTGFASGNQFAGASLATSVGASGVSGAASVEPTTKPEYAYQYQVSDDIDQTYITHNEARDGNDVTGAYSYVDANGDLVTVNYQAGADGYSQTLEKEAGVVEIRAKPVKVQAIQQVASSTSGAAGARFATNSGSSSGSNFVSSSGSNFGSTSGSTFRGNAASSSGSRYNSGSSSTSSTGSSSGFTSGARYSSGSSSTSNVSSSTGSSSGFSTGSSSASLDQSALIAQILSALQPQISVAVSSAVANI